MIDTRKVALDVIEELGASRQFWDEADGCQPFLTKAERLIATAFREALREQTDENANLRKELDTILTYGFPVECNP